MERILVKTGIYSFIVSFCLLVIFKSQKLSETDEEGWTSFTEIPFPEYFFTIFRYSIITCFITVLFVLLYLLVNKTKPS